MNRITSIGLTALLGAALCCAAPAANAALLFERSLFVDRSPNIFTSSDFKLNFLFGNSFLSPTNPVTLFSGLVVSPANIGQEFEANASNDPSFNAAAQRMTDALNEKIVMLFSEVLASNRIEKRGSEEDKFFLGHGSPQTPDLAGATIDAIRLRIDDFTLVFGAPPANPLAVTTPPVLLSMTFSVFGTPVPEPSTLALGGAMALAALAAYTRAHRRRTRAA